ncbi:MAG: CarD family transcriptional regulator [Bacilli bacterium]|nr:CarD family transcriptional regulator [Bacilli bacterium]
MFKINSYVMYKNDVCIVKDISKNKYTNKECYTLVPVVDNTLKISIPTDNKNIRKIITKSEVEDLINKIPNIDVIKTDAHNLEVEYRNLIHTSKHEDLIKIIKTTYLRNKKRIDEKRSASQKDKEYFEKAEKYLYSEIAVSLGISYDDAKKYVVSKVEEKENEKDIK